ncbi:MAG TPA: DUF72 domain-containing protein [Puia sp.]|jgi:uncharacterized protein YecE (DUF72 family)|nr:DUF72 domain-containing protein [Puia sp.]
MEFGKVQHPDKIDFSLPPDDIMTEELLKGLDRGPKGPLQLYVGATRWRIKEWVGAVYPQKTKEKDFLSQYVRQFNTIELNAMWYNLQPKDVIEKWAALAGDVFRYCPKYSNTISHELQLKDAGKDTDLFIDHMRHFGRALGPSFLQLSDGFGPDRTALLHHYLRQLPPDFRTCVELRQESWFTGGAHQDTWRLFHELGVGTVITDTSGRRDVIHMRLTAPVAFIRFVSNSGHVTDHLRIDAWADRIKSWVDRGLREVYFFVHAHDEMHTPALAAYAIGQLNKRCGTHLVPPKSYADDAAKPLTLF